MTSAPTPSSPPPATGRWQGLGMRTLSALALLALLFVAFTLGHWAIRAVIVLVSVGMFYEWWRLTRGWHVLWKPAGIVYVAAACAAWWVLGTHPGILMMVLGLVIGADVGAYFFGRLIGGPKLAPRISPKKTWAGLAGGIIGGYVLGTFCLSTVFMVTYGMGWNNIPEILHSWIRTMVLGFQEHPSQSLYHLGIVTALVIAAQLGDLFESWMKRKAGVKDSGNLIPGHGGILDRVDGLVPVSIIVAIVEFFSW